MAEADSDDDGAADVTPAQGTDPEQPVVASSGSGGDESGTAIDAAMSVSAAGAAGARGVEVMSSRNLNLLATVCLLEENESCGGIESGGGDGANHDVSVDFRSMAEHVEKKKGDC